MADATEDQRFYLESEFISEECGSDIHYDSITEIGDSTIDDLESEGGLDSIVRSIREINDDIVASTKKTEFILPQSDKKAEVVDDFVRNFLVRMGMRRTLDCFQTEWYELMHRGLLPEHEAEFVADVYEKNVRLAHELAESGREAQRYKLAALRAKEAFQKLRKERDFHRMHHKRVKQEKDRVITDLKKLKEHYRDYEPALQHLKKRYQTAMKEKMLTRLERDRAVGQLQGLAISSANPRGRVFQEASLHTCNKGEKILINAKGQGPTQRKLADGRNKGEPIKALERHPNDSKFPVDDGLNPDLIAKAPNAGHQTRTGGLHQNHSFQAHSHAVSSVCLHPRKQLLCTTGDDGCWKLWSIPASELVMTGQGHTDWVSHSDFHPSGTKLATTSGDATIKIWDFNQVQCLHTFTDHSQAVWSCSWHSCGHFLVTSSMDNTAKVWDINSLRCRFTLRGHTDSVNSASFMPYSNTIITSSADKTISLWDARTGLCGQTFYGHSQSVNHCTFNSRCDMIASCDSYGTVKLWDLRNGSPITTIDCGPHPCNHVQFDPSGTALAIASNDSTIRIFNVSNAQIDSLAGHEDAVQGVAFDKSGEFLVSCSSDLTVKIWS